LNRQKAQPGTGRNAPGLDTALSSIPPILLSASIVNLGGPTEFGLLIEGVTNLYFAIVSELKKNPDFVHTLSYRQLEELVAGTYERDGWEVELTPRSGDQGRDVIAKRSDIGRIRILDQVKAYRPGHLVPADDVRALFGVLSRDADASKAVMTTSSRFAPGVYEEFGSIPHRLELRDGPCLLEWLLREVE